jgi:LysR family transcriptional regulator of gallate degradation
VELAQLRHFIAVAENGSIGQAARALRLTQPGVTKSIRRLEGALGVRLIERRPRGVELTEEGRRLLEHARLIQLQADDARREVISVSGGETEELAIGAGPSWISRHLPIAVGRLIAERPNVRIRIVGGFNDRLLAALHEGQLDIVIAALPEAGPPDGLTAIPLTHDDLEIVARQDHPLFARRKRGLADLLAATWILPGREVATRVRFEALFLVRGVVPPAPIIESDSISFILATLRESDLLGFCTRQLLVGEEARGLATLDITGFSVRRDAGIVYRTRSVLGRAAGTLVGHLRAICVEHLRKN